MQEPLQNQMMNAIHFKHKHFPCALCHRKTMSIVKLRKQLKALKENRDTQRDLKNKKILCYVCAILCKRWLAYACLWAYSVCEGQCVCDKCIGGTVGCVLKISHSQQPVPTLQRDYTALQTVKKERTKEGKEERNKVLPLR